MKTNLLIQLLIVLLLASPVIAQSNNKGLSRARAIKDQTPYFINTIGASAYLGKHRSGFGLNYSGFEYNPKKSGFIDFTIGYEQLVKTKRVDGKPTYFKMKSGQFGFNVYPRLYKDLFLKFGLFINGGIDTREYSVSFPTLQQKLKVKNSFFVFGGSASQGITYIPTKNTGISLSLSFYQRASIVGYDLFDLGALLSVGICF